MHQPQYQIFSFDGLMLDLKRGCLFGRNGGEIKLRPKSFDVLAYLVQNGGRLISKEELIGSVWAGTAVTDDSLVQCLIDVRRALADSGQRLVKTVPRRGYIFQAPVTVTALAEQEPRATGDAERPGVTVSGAVLARDTPASGQPLPLPVSKPTPFRLLAVAVAGVGVLLAALVLISDRLRIDSAEGPPSPIRSIAVLPLENLSADPTQEYFADGMTDSLITNLSRIRALRVISRTSVMRYKGGHTRLPDIARELNVDAVIEGSKPKLTCVT